jgi:hypothetical protein
VRGGPCAPSSASACPGFLSALRPCWRSGRSRPAPAFVSLPSALAFRSPLRRRPVAPPVFLACPRRSPACPLLSLPPRWRPGAPCRAPGVPRRAPVVLLACPRRPTGLPLLRLPYSPALPRAFPGVPCRPPGLHRRASVAPTACSGLSSGGLRVSPRCAPVVLSPFPVAVCVWGVRGMVWSAPLEVTIYRDV